MDLRERLGREDLVGIAARHLQPMPYVVSRYGLIHGPQSLAQARPLPQLREARVVQHFIERRLAGQHDGHDAAVLRVDARQQAQFLERGRVQVLGLVDDDDDVPPREVLLEEEGPELVEQLDLLRAVVGEAEFREQRLQQLDVAQRRVDQSRRDVLRAQGAERRVEHGRLAGADLTGDHDETVVIQQREAHVRCGARVLPRQEQEFRVRRQVERATVQLEEVVVHAAVIRDLQYIFPYAPPVPPDRGLPVER